MSISYEEGEWKVSETGKVAHLVAEGVPACSVDYSTGIGSVRWRSVPGVDRCRDCERIDQGFRLVGVVNPEDPESKVWVKPI